MKKISLLFWSTLLVFCISCSPDKEDKKENQVTTSNQNESSGHEDTPRECEKISLKGFEEDSLFVKYQSYLNGLDCYKPESIGLAGKELVSYISKCDTNKADSLFYLFNNYYSIVTGKLNEVVSGQENEFVSFVSSSEDAKSKPSKKAQQFYNDLRKYGFDFEYPEGMLGVKQDRGFIKNKFYGYLSEHMKSYLTALDEDVKDVFAEDAGIMVDEKEFFKRIITWEKLANQNTQFLFSQECKDNNQYYLDRAINGMDNTPTFGGEDNTISEYFKNLYEMAENAPVETENVKILKKHYQIIKDNGNKDSDQRAEYIKELQKENKIMTY